MPVPDQVRTGVAPPDRPIRGAAAVDALAHWSDWIIFAEAATQAPTMPGVYMAALPGSGEIIYVGMAGERHGQGLRGRLAAYQSGRGVVSGFGAAAMDRALQDVDWLRGRLSDLEAGIAASTRDWATAAIVRINPHIRWTTTPDRHSARELERRVLAALANDDLWNKAR